MTDYDRIEALALLRGVNTSLLHLLATAPIYVLTPIAEAYKSARTAIRILEFRSLDAPKQSEADSVAFRHGDIDAVCGSVRGDGKFAQPPNCTHPMHAVALEMAEATIPKRRSESAWAVTWPSEVTRPCEKSAGPQTEYQTLVGN